jgi:hypothetical protein
MTPNRFVVVDFFDPANAYGGLGDLRGLRSRRLGAEDLQAKPQLDAFGKVRIYPVELNVEVLRRSDHV